MKVWKPLFGLLLGNIRMNWKRALRIFTDGPMNKEEWLFILGFFLMCVPQVRFLPFGQVQILFLTIHFSMFSFQTLCLLETKGGPALMCLCRLCGWITHHEAEYLLTYGRHDWILKVCRWCEQDLELMGFHINQTVKLPKVAQSSFFTFFNPFKRLEVPA
jgi:hypothetical protein